MRKLFGVITGMMLVGVMLVPGRAQAADHSGDPHWIQDPTSGCWIYNAEPQHDESMAWEGPSCGYGGEANGVGTVTWFQYNAWTLAEKGEMRGGLMQGDWIRRFKSGDVEHAFWVDGVRQQPAYAEDGGGSGDSSSGYSSVYDPNAYMETLKRQNRENCERAAKGADIACHPE